MNYNEEELKLVDYQMIISGILLIIIGVSLALGYNHHLKLTGQKTFWDEEEVRNISLFLKIAGLIAALAAVYVSIKAVQLAKERGEDLTNAYLEEAASILAFIAAILIIIVVFRHSSDFFLNLENPEL